MAKISQAPENTTQNNELKRLLGKNIMRYMTTPACEDETKFEKEFLSLMDKYYPESAQDLKVIWFDTLFERQEFLNNQMPQKNSKSQYYTALNQDIAAQDLLGRIDKSGSSFLVRDRLAVLLQFGNAASDTMISYILGKSSIQNIANTIVRGFLCEETSLLKSPPFIENTLNNYLVYLVQRANQTIQTMEIEAENLRNIGEDGAAMSLISSSRGEIARIFSLRSTVTGGLELISRLTAASYVGSIINSKNKMQTEYSEYQRIFEYRKEFLERFAFEILGINQFKNYILIVRKWKQLNLDNEGNFHSEIGPAVTYGSENFYFHHGLMLRDQGDVDGFNNPTIPWIKSIRNNDVRRMAIVAYGVINWLAIHDEKEIVNTSIAPYGQIETLYRVIDRDEDGVGIIRQYLITADPAAYNGEHGENDHAITVLEVPFARNIWNISQITAQKFETLQDVVKRSWKSPGISIIKTVSEAQAWLHSRSTIYTFQSMSVPDDVSQYPVHRT